MGPQRQTTPSPSVWSSMSYTPPRGRCNYKPYLMNPVCACLRFMLHPIKAATSFECDGCNHHASYHSMENPGEDAIVQKWAEQESERKQLQLSMPVQSSVNGGRRKAVTARTETRAGARKKRKQSEEVDDDVVEVDEVD